MAQWKYIISMVLFLFSATVFAEFYRFVDKDGTIHYTDDLNKVPEDKLYNIEKYKEIESDTRYRPADGQINKKSQMEKTDYLKKQKQFVQRRAILEEELQILIKEKQVLEADKESLAKKPRWLRRRKTIELNSRAAILNKKIENYERKKNKFNNEVDASNTPVEKALTIEKYVIRKSKGGVRY
ncbi:MAG: DUF4124 domain-containing protein [Candidatus Zixiibacteriota bacterium]